ncbi:MAG: hypothetical protein QF704_00040 [Anaerolineales bacterium]|jgi:hypothetical protein|nr:hypothetical protein [Anaerolineales bacterium]
MSVKIYYEADTTNPRWYLEDSFQQAFPELEIPDDVWDKMNEKNKVDINELIETYGE